MQSEGELRFCISLYEIFVNLDFKNMSGEIIATQSRNTIHERKNGVKLKKLICNLMETIHLIIRIKSYSIVRNYVES